MKRAEEGQLRYTPRMRRNAKSITTSPEIVKQIHGLTHANFDMMTKLIEWLAGHEKQHTNYRLAMIDRLTRVEAAVSLILVGQQAQNQSRPPWFLGDKLEEDAKLAEKCIAKQSEQIAMKMIRCIYGKDPVPEPKRDRRRKWSGWEI